MLPAPGGRAGALTLNLLATDGSSRKRTRFPLRYLYSLEVRPADGTGYAPVRKAA